MVLDDLRYEAHEDFNQSIDDDEGVITVLDTQFRASEILFTLQKETYRIALTDFEERQAEELKQLAFNVLPDCIAYHYWQSQRGPNSNNPIERFLHLKDSWEAVIFTLNALVWGEVRANSIDLKAADVYHSGAANLRFNSRVLLSDELKQILENVKAVVNYSTTNGLHLKCGDNITLDLINTLNELQNNRNHFSHTATPTREQAEEELRVVLPLFKTVLKNLRFFEDISILRFDSFTTKCRFQTFKAHSLSREFDDNIEVQAAQQVYVMTNAGEVIFAKWVDEIFSLSPFMHYKHDTTGHETYLSVYKGKRESKFWYEPVKVRENICFDPLQARFDAEKEELQNLIVPTI
jgi:hypothetical protein